MLRPGWTDEVHGALRAALLGLGMSTLAACGMVGGTAVPATADASAEPASPEIQQQYAELVVRLQSGEAGSVADLEKFSSAHPDLAGPLLNLGLVRARAGDDAGAREYLERATSVCARCGPAWNELGVLHRQQGRFADAEQAYRRGIEVESGYAPAYYNLAVLYELYLPRPDLALQNYELYLQMAGGDAQGDDVEKWVADLRRRVGTTPKTASAEGTP